MLQTPPAAVRLLALAAAAAVSAIPRLTAAAADSPPLPSQAAQEMPLASAVTPLAEITHTATRTPRRVDAVTGTVSVIGADDIGLVGAGLIVQAADAARALPAAA